MANHPTTELWHVICRGGWDFGSYTTTFEYLLQLVVTLSVGGRALCGAPNSRSKLYPPSLLPITNPTTSEVLEVLKFKLFDIGYKAGSLDGQLRSVCLASILLNLRSFIADLSMQHRLIRHIKKIISPLKINGQSLDINQLMEWGDTIKKHWEVENVTAATNNIMNVSLQIAALEERLIVTQEQVKNSVKELFSVNERIREQTSMLNEIIRFVKAQELKASADLSMRTPPKIMNSGSGSKRNRSEEEIPSINSIESEEVVVSGNENAFEVISHGRTFATIASLKNLTLQDMLTNWFEFDISQSSDLFCKNATIRDKVRTVMKFVLEKIVTPEDLEQLQIKRPDDHNSLSYHVWRNQLRSHVHAVSERAFKAIEELEQTTFGEKKTSRASNVTSLYDRLTAVKQRKPDIPINSVRATMDQFLLK